MSHAQSDQLSRGVAAFGYLNAIIISSFNAQSSSWMLISGAALNFIMRIGVTILLRYEMLR